MKPEKGLKNGLFYTEKNGKFTDEPFMEESLKNDLVVRKVLIAMGVIDDIVCVPKDPTED